MNLPLRLTTIMYALLSMYVKLNLKMLKGIKKLTRCAITSVIPLEVHV